MKLNRYLKDHLLHVIVFLVVTSIIIGILRVFKAPMQAIIAIVVTLSLGIISCFIYDYYRKWSFYHVFLERLEALNQKYLITEMLVRPSFYEGQILCDALYDIDKSMNEKIKEYRLNLIDFKDYIEMWIHEVKLPLAAMQLIVHNQDKDRKLLKQLKIMNDDVEQVLYYVRSENAEKDYLIKETSLNKIISNIALRNKDILLENHIDFHVDIPKTMVLTDSKWLEFILNQIVNNSIQYCKQDEDSMISISLQNKQDHIVLKIYDNGIGIPSSDLPKVFNKTFTGENGRYNKKSTGMGLTIVKGLCDKLGHRITIDSIEGKYTLVQLSIPVAESMFQNCNIA